MQQLLQTFHTRKLFRLNRKWQKLTHNSHCTRYKFIKVLSFLATNRSELIRIFNNNQHSFIEMDKKPTRFWISKNLCVCIPQNLSKRPPSVKQDQMDEITADSHRKIPQDCVDTVGRSSYWNIVGVHPFKRGTWHLIRRSTNTPVWPFYSYIIPHQRGTCT